MNAEDLKPNKILRGPIFPEPVQIILRIPMGDAMKLITKVDYRLEQEWTI